VPNGAAGVPELWDDGADSDRNEAREHEGGGVMTIIQHRDCGDEQEGDMSDEQAAGLNENAKLRYWCEGCGESFYVDDPTFDHAVHDRSCDGSCRSCPVQCGPIHIDYDFAHRAVRLLSEREDALRAENERLLREQAEFTGAALCALGLNRDECVSPGNQVLDE